MPCNEDGVRMSDAELARLNTLFGKAAPVQAENGSIAAMVERMKGLNGPEPTREDRIASLRRRFEALEREEGKSELLDVLAESKEAQAIRAGMEKT